MATKRTYTRRTTRDRVVALLEEAIQLVKARCVEPEKGLKVSALQAPVMSVSNFSKAIDNAMVDATPEAQDILEKSRLEFEKAVQLKKEANAMLEATEPEGALEKADELKKQANMLLQTASKIRGDKPLTLTTVNTTLKKKLPSCPGGPKAFNEYFKKMRPVVEGEMGPNVKYADVRAEIAKRWKESCALSGKTRKVSKTKATPGRVNAVAEVAPLSAVPEGNEEQSSEVPYSPESPASSASPASSTETGYTNLGMDDTLGMRKIEIDGRPLYMTDTNSGIFERDNDEAGAFVGYIRNGKLVEQDEPDE